MSKTEVREEEDGNYLQAV